MTLRTHGEYPASAGQCRFLTTPSGARSRRSAATGAGSPCVAIVALTPAAIAQGALESAAADADGLRAALLWGLAAAAGLIGYYVLCAVIAQIALAQRRGVERPAVGAIARTLPWATLVAVDLVVSIGTAVGLELLVVPGIVFGTWFSLAPTLVETHHLGAGRRSSAAAISSAGTSSP